METGIVGLPLSGKTTLFNLLTRSGAQTGFAAGRKAVNLGVSRVPDPRVDRLSEIWRPRKTTPATIHYVDVAGVERSAEGEGLSPETLAHLKNTDALLVVVRAFDSQRVPHPEGSVDPLRDLGALHTEFLLSDLIIVESRLERIAKQARGRADRELAREKEVLERCRAILEADRPLRDADLKPDEEKVIRGFQFLTLKPLVIVVNLGEDDVGRAEEIVAPVRERWDGPNAVTVGLCATVEQ